MIKFLPLDKLNGRYSDEIRKAVLRVVESGRYLTGTEVRGFEYDYSEFTQTGNCVTCASGLDALWLILRAYIELGVMEPGDEVLVPANTFVASILAITDNGLKPVLVEP